MSKFTRYLWYVLRHKWFVAMACLERGLYWRALVHDWSKLLPSEFVPYAQFFYGGYRFGEAPAEVRDAFDRAWLKHQRRNSHHYQAYILHEDSGAVKVLAMDETDRQEMLCDWQGAGMAINGRNDTLGWYTKNYDRIRLHPATRAWVDAELGYVPPISAATA